MKKISIAYEYVVESATVDVAALGGQLEQCRGEADLTGVAKDFARSW